MLKNNASFVNAIFRLLDVFLIGFAGYFAFVIRFQQFGGLSYHYAGAILLACLLVGVGFSFFGVYGQIRGRSVWRLLPNVMLAWLMLFFTLSSVAVFLKLGNTYSRSWFLSWILASLVVLVSSRLLIFYGLMIVRKSGFNTRNVVIIGTGSLARKACERLTKASGYGYQTVCFIEPEAAKKNKKINGIPVVAIPTEMEKFIATHNIDEVWVALPLHALGEMQDIFYRLRFSTANIRVLPDIFEFDLLNHSVSEIAGIPVINLRASPIQGINQILKFAEDKVIALVILILISPILMLISLAVKVSSKGPIFYIQKRYGFDGKVIRVYKFRSMYLHDDETILKQASKDDGRVTTVGKFLRKTSLDELPQFINVLQGRMSIVGPRPHAVSHNEHYKQLVKKYMQRHMVKPGITGWAQINGFRGETDTLDKMEKRVEYDLYYIENWSLFLDLKIIALTIVKGFFAKNAY